MKTNITEIELQNMFRALKEKVESGSYLYAIPKSGLIVALMINASVLKTLEEAKGVLRMGYDLLIIDDIYDSGTTEKRMKEIFKDHLDQIEFHYLIDKRREYKNDWISWPWEDYEELVNGEDEELRKKQFKEGTKGK